MGSLPPVSIVLVNWNGWKNTTLCLASLQEVDYPDVDIIVVDNNSTDDSVSRIREKYTFATVLESGENLGYAGGSNIGIRYALEHGAEYVWLLNNDTLIDENALKALISRMQQDPEIGICGSKLIRFPDCDTVQALGGGTYDPWMGKMRELGIGEPEDRPVDREEIEQKMDYVAGASMLVSRRFLEEVGLMNEEYFLYFEEIDWAWRGRKSFKLGFAMDSRVYHKGGGTILTSARESTPRSRMCDYYRIRNWLRFTRNFHPWMLPVTYISLIATLLKRIYRGQGSRVPMILKIMLTLGLEGKKPLPAVSNKEDYHGFPDHRKQDWNHFF